MTVASTSQPQTSTFDPYNPYSFAAERQAREQLIERQQQLPHPLTFRLVNPVNGRIVFAGIREFSAGENEIGISTFLRKALGLEEPELSEGAGADVVEGSTDGVSGCDAGERDPRLTIHVQELPKGTFVKLRPLEAGYDPEDWKALLEQYLRDNYTTLSNGEVLTIPAGKEVFRFLVDGLKPNTEGITLVDTDLEVDIEPLNEEQARETLQKLVQKSQKAPGTVGGSSAGGPISPDVAESGQVRAGDYVDYTLGKWDMKQDIELELTPLNDDTDIDLFVTPAGPTHRTKPRDTDYVFGDASTRATKRIKIKHTNTELENAEAIWVSVRGYEIEGVASQTRAPVPYSLLISTNNDSSDRVVINTAVADQPSVGPDEERCSNCHQAVPSRTMFLHQNFCLRNNVLCPQCNQVFQKGSTEWKDHWHCLHDDAYGSSIASHIKHDTIMHTATSCPSCEYEAANIPDLAHHRTTTCPGRLILCRFCHLQVPQQRPDDPPADSAEVILSGLTPHELSDGARTTECHICSKITRLRDMSTHLKHHDLQRLSRSKPRICRNANCGRTIDGIGKGGEVAVQAARNDLGVCDVCFGPLYVSMYDPDGKALKRRVERKMLTQLLTGCNQSLCCNSFCKTGRSNLGLSDEGQTTTSKEALREVKPIVENLQDREMPVFFCTDEANQKRRTLAEMIAAEGGTADSSKKGKMKESLSGSGGYDLEWCVAALESAGGDLGKGRTWLENFAPTKAEGRR